MNANTALKINDAINQAIRCGESVEEVQHQVEVALVHALNQKHASDMKKVTRPITRP